MFDLDGDVDRYRFKRALGYKGLIIKYVKGGGGSTGLLIDASNAGRIISDSPDEVRASFCAVCTGMISSPLTPVPGVEKPATLTMVGYVGLVSAGSRVLKCLQPLALAGDPVLVILLF